MSGEFINPHTCCAALDSEDLGPGQMVAGSPAETDLVEGRSAKYLSLLNSLLLISLEDIPLERQLLGALDVLLSIPWLPLRPEGAVFLVGEEPDVLVLAASRGPFDADCVRVPFGHCLCGRTAAGREFVCVESTARGGDASGERADLHGYYGVPLLHNGRVLGVLSLYPKDGHRRDPDEIEFLRAVASILAGIVERSRDTERVQRLLAQNRQLNRRLIALQEEEYRRLARELHDEIGQSLTVIKTEAFLLPQMRAVESMQRGVEAIGAEADRIYETMHDIVRRLRPRAIDDLGLVAALEAHIADWQRRRPTLLCQFNAPGGFDDLDDQVRITIYRLVQECLTNVMRHAAANEVSIALAREAGAEGGQARGTVVLSVRDNGRGMDVTKMRERSGRFGLLGMRERVEALGGTLVIDSAPDRGFGLAARIPIPERRKNRGVP